MRAILAASAAIFIASSAPSMARDYAWCARSITGPFGDCSFASYRQCRATVGGQRRECISNPRLAYGSYGWRDGSGWYAGEAHDYDFWHDTPYGWNHWR